jgi:hypothetical protein
MRAARTVLLLVAVAASTLAERRAIAAEASHETASDDHPLIAPLAPRPPATDPGSLGCECAPLAALDWHWSERRILGLKALGFGVLTGTAGVVLAMSARRLSLEADQRSQLQSAAVSQFRQIHDREVVAAAFLGAAAVSALAGAALVLWPESHRVSVTVLPSGGALVACGGTI